MRIPFGLANQNVDPAEYRHGVAASVRECYRSEVGGAEHWTKRPGLSAFATGMNSPIKGIFVTSAGTVLALGGTTVYSLSSSGTATAYTGTVTGSSPARWAENATGIYLAAGGGIVAVDTTAQTVTAVGGDSPSNVTHLVTAAGYLLANGLRTGGSAGDINYSDDSANSWATWESFNNEAHPDGCTAVFVGWDNEVYGFGPKTVEVSYNDGTTPWAKLQGATMQYGLLAPHSVVIADNTLVWLTEAEGARHFVKMVNRAPQIVSMPYARVLNELATVSDAIAWTQPIHGKTFYLVTFPTVGKTWAMDLQAETWSEFGHWDTATAAYVRYLGRCSIYVEAWNKILVGAHGAGTIYQQTGTTDAGGAIRMELTSGRMDHGTNRKKREQMLVHAVKRGSGAGGVFGFRKRDDNGQWKDETSHSLGALGNTKPYLTVPSGGVYRSRQYQYIHADTGTDFIVMGLEAELD